MRSSLLRLLSVTLKLLLHLQFTFGETKDSTGLVGTSPALLLDSAQLPLQFWANPRKSALKPRKRDLHEPTLMALLGSDYDANWMKKSRPSLTPEAENDDDRIAVRTLRGLLNGNGGFNGEPPLRLPAELPAEYKKIVEEWLVKRATCAIKFVWDNLGPYFWPRWVRRGECLKGNSSCSWPPGMSCEPGGARNLHVLRWHCRLRKHQRLGKKRSKSENQVWSGEGANKSDASVGKSRRKKRRKYRCFWIKVPYPVPEDCVCACADKDMDSDDDPDSSEDR